MTMKTIDLQQLASVSGGVVDSGNGQGCTRSGGCIPSPLPRPRPPWTLPGSDTSIPGWPALGGGQSVAQ
jgi:hypothetical protein